MFYQFHLRLGPIRKSRSFCIRLRVIVVFALQSRELRFLGSREIPGVFVSIAVRLVPMRTASLINTRVRTLTHPG